MNAYFQVMSSDFNDAESICSCMLSALEKPNLSTQVIESQNLNRKYSSFETMSVDSLVEFPRFSPEDLRQVALGSYVLKQAKSYYAEHVSVEGKYLIQVARYTDSLRLGEYNINCDDPPHLKSRIQSRHRSQTMYFLYILINKSAPGVDSIVGFSCQCKIGMRTFGCCAHIMTVLWYLGHGRHQLHIQAPADFLNHACVVLESTDEMLT